MLQQPRGDQGHGGGLVGGKKKKPRVGIVKTLSPSLSRNGVSIAIFTRNSVLTFYGNVKVRVLGGVVNLESFAVKPSELYVNLCIPRDRSHTAMSMRSMDPHSKDQEFTTYLKPFRYGKLLHFHSKANPHTPCSVPGSHGKGCVILDIGDEDIATLNKLAKDDWEGIAAIALLCPYKDDLTCSLSRHGLGVESSQQLSSFSTAKVDEALQMPDSYKKIAWDIMDHEGASVLVCGDMGTGKSVLGRCLVNYLLNRCPEVGYLECDPGQCEFTCPGVLSLHVLKEPVYGPPYAHQRPPLKGFYFGAKSPRSDPEYYIRLLQSLYAHFTTSVRASSPRTPLIINTCGWLNDMGVQLFLDLLRSLSPSHVVRLVPKRRRSEDILKILPPLTEEFLTVTPGLFTPALSNPWASNAPEDSKPHELFGFGGQGAGGKSPCLGVDGVGARLSLEDLKTLSSRVAHKEDVLSSDMEMYGSSEEEFNISESSNEDEMSGVGDKEERVRKKRKLKRKRLHLANAKLNNEKKEALERGRWVQIPPTSRWEQMLSYKVQCVEAPSTKQKNSIQQRKLRLVSYFSPLLSKVGAIAKQYKLPDPHGNLLRYAPPLAIPWSDVALHVAHKPVSTDHLLYAFNGKIICLGHVEPDQITSFSADIFKLLKLQTPLIEFVGLGLLRAIDPSKKMFYVTTPLTAAHLAKVNVFVLGNSDEVGFNVSGPPPSADTECVPYQGNRFKPVELGEYAWGNTQGRAW